MVAAQACLGASQHLGLVEDFLAPDLFEDVKLMAAETSSSDPESEGSVEVDNEKVEGSKD